MPPNLQACKALTERRYTPYFGLFHFNGGLYGLRVPSRDCHGPVGPRNDKPEGIAPMNLCRKYCHPARRSLSAATPHISAFSILTAACTGCECLPEIATAPLGPRNDKLGGVCHFNGGLYGLRVPRRARHASPLQRTTGSPATLSTLHFPRKKSRTCVREFFSQSSIQILKLPISPSGSPLRPSGPRRAAPCPSGSASPATGSSR